MEAPEQLAEDTMRLDKFEMIPLWNSVMLVTLNLIVFRVTFVNCKRIMLNSQILYNMTGLPYYTSPAGLV